MIKFFLLGFVTGLPFTISFGPVFFAITETSLKRGFWAGTIVAFGIVLSDIIYVTLIGLGFTTFFRDEFSQSIFAVFGGIMFLIFGISFLKKNIELKPDSTIPVSKRPIQSFLKGFAINTMNPYVALFWVGVVAVASTELNLTGNAFIMYFSGFLLVLLVSDILKAWLAEVFRKKLSKKLKVIYRVLGVIFCGFGVKLLWDSIAYFLN